MNENLICKIKQVLGGNFEVKPVCGPAQYIVDNNIVGMGYVRLFIPVKENWYITISNYMSSGGLPFSKILLHYNDEENKRFNRCHSYYIDENDLKNKGGTTTTYDDPEIIISLINHALNNDEKTCTGCRGEDPLQTHYIQLI